MTLRYTLTIDKQAARVINHYQFYQLLSLSVICVI